MGGERTARTSVPCPSDDVCCMTSTPDEDRSAIYYSISCKQWGKGRERGRRGVKRRVINEGARRVVEKSVGRQVDWADGEGMKQFEGRIEVLGCR